MTSSNHPAMASVGKATPIHAKLESRRILFLASNGFEVEDESYCCNTTFSGNAWYNGNLYPALWCRTMHPLGRRHEDTGGFPREVSATVTRNSAIADKPARRVYRSVKVTKHSTVPYIRYSFLLCNGNFIFLFFISIFLRYSTSKNVLNLKSGSEVTQFHWKWHHSKDCIWIPICVLQ